MKLYQINYNNGMIQVKSLIPSSDYEEIIKPLLNEAHQLEIDKLDKASKAIKRFINKTFGDYFVIGSPMYRAITYDVLELPISQGGNHPIKLKMLN